MDCDGLRTLCRNADVAVLDCSFPIQRRGPNHMDAGDCGRVAQAAAVKRLILSHFYPIAERYDVKQQAGRHFKGRIIKARDLTTLTV
jgi:ribonuclease BN (tRNA processing enzyme)